jgi:Holliday junction resolvase RusA-like endonuclease
MQINIPIKTPSINHLHGHNRFGNVYLKPEAKKLRTEIQEAVLSSVGQSFEEIKNMKLKVITEIYENWMTKDENVKRIDIGNREKFLIDTVFEALGIDDKFIFEHTMKKVQSETDERAVITIEIL